MAGIKYYMPDIFIWEQNKVFTLTGWHLAPIFNFFRINLAMQPFFYIKLIFRKENTWFDKK